MPSGAAEVLPRSTERAAVWAFELAAPEALDERELGVRLERTELGTEA